MTVTRLAPLALAIAIVLTGCATSAPEPAPTASEPEPGGPTTCELASGESIMIELPAGFGPVEGADCDWSAGETYLSLTSTSDVDLIDIRDRADEAESWIGIGGDEDVSDFSFDEDVDLFTAHQGDLLAYRSAADGVPIIVIVGQSDELQLYYSASADGSDVATELARFRSIAATITAE